MKEITQEKPPMIRPIIDRLAATSSRNDKIAILKEHEKNDLLRRVFVACYDPFKNYWIKQIPSYTDTDNPMTLEWALEQLTLLENRTHTGNAASEHLSHILSSISEDDRVIIRYILNHDLECGVSSKTINKVWKGLIPSFPVMLCSSNDGEEKTRKVIQFPAIVQEKADGGRCITMVRQNGVVEHYTRNGNQIDLFGRFDDIFVKMANGSDVVYDGEILIMENGVVSNRQTGNGIITKAVRGTLKQSDAEGMVLQLWDRIPLDEFKKGVSVDTYEDRLINLDSDLFRAGNPSSVTLIETHWVDGFNDVDVLFQKYLEDGKEGIILKNAGSLFENKRVKHQIKYKAELDCDLRVKGIQEGTGKYAGMIGALILESDDCNLQVSCGSGLTDADRQIPEEEWFNKIVTVKYNAKIRDKKGKKKTSLFLPIFVSVREDKNTTNTEGEIK
jgi:ATP-dependent DNA ligase